MSIQRKAGLRRSGGVISPTSVTLNKTTLSLVTGANETLTATVLPANATNKNVTWSSSDSTIATVDTKGKVVAVKAGTATITVKTVDGDKSADCELTVTTP
ncbi:Ig-like domain-containing protein [Enterococcus faecium]|uniref:Ig-like domain-containing protein n=1 Tax=Enterococcus faecium TaxID=1352 RepID=UPI003132EC79